MQNMGKMLILIGLVIVVIGLIYNYFPNALSWIGKLPGDIRVEKPNMKFYFPITTMIILSILLNVFLRIFRHFQ